MTHRTLSIRAILVMTVVLAVSGPAIVLQWREIERQRETLEPLFAQSRERMLNVLATNLAEHLWTLDEQGLGNIANRALAAPEVMAIRIEEARASQPTRLFSRPPDPQALPVRLSAPIVREGQLLAGLEVTFDNREIEALLRSQRNRALLTIGLQVLVSVAGLLFILYLRLVAPLQRLKDQASRMADMQLDERFAWQQRDEMGELGRHLDLTREHLRGLFAQIEDKNRELERLALFDPLTELPNRSLFKQICEHEITTAERERRKIAVVFLDLDRFKVVNDSLGHQKGDELLIEMSRRLRAAVRGADVVGRTGGDEFLLLLHDAGQWSQVVGVADRVLKALEEPIQLGADEVRVSGSLGIAMYPDDGGDYATLVKHADIAMYQAKSLGRAQYQFFHAGLNARLSSKLEVQTHLLRAIEAGEFVLHFQPQLDTRTGRWTGCEALVRWQHPVRGLLFPDSFIGTAEESGLINELGAWVIDAACAQIQAWRDRGVVFERVAVNISAVQFRHHRLLDHLMTAMQRHGVRASQLELEITETILMTDTDTSGGILERLHQAGLSVAIDDFGTGHSSMAYLKRMRPTKLKIDRSFVRDITNDRDDRSIVKAMIDMAMALGMEVVAEGVETAEQAALLASLGCTCIQGYHIARPMPADQLVERYAAAA